MILYYFIPHGFGKKKHKFLLKRRKEEDSSGKVLKAYY